jgi:multicomponent Na+:H+ antiporter subunit F
MTEWEIAAAVLCATLVPCGAVAMRASFAEGIVGVQLASIAASLALLTLAEAQRRQSFATLALVVVVLAFAGTLLFLRFLEREG